MVREGKEGGVGKLWVWKVEQGVKRDYFPADCRTGWCSPPEKESEGSHARWIPLLPVPSRAVSIGTRGNCRTISSCSCSKHFNAV